MELPALKTIGIAGGVGPYAGLDLLKKVYNNTLAYSDQDHLKIVLFSLSSEIPDRTEYLLDKSNPSPVNPMFRVLKKMDDIGIDVAGIACNTFHSEKIYFELKEEIEKAKLRLQLLNMIKEVSTYVERTYPNGCVLGVLASRGTVTSKIYEKKFHDSSYKCIYPSDDYQNKVDEAIYNPLFGIKSKSSPVTDKAVEYIRDTIRHLKAKSVDTVVLGCTELPLAITDGVLFGIPVIDPTRVLARALIRKVDINKLVK